MSRFPCMCFSCGYQWPRGQNGTHSCAQQLRGQIDEHFAEIERLKDQNSELIIQRDYLLSALEAALPFMPHSFRGKIECAIAKSKEKV